MATKLERPVTRETMGRRGALIVRMTPAGLYVKDKGRKTWYGPISWGRLYEYGAQLAAAERAIAKAEKREAVKRVSRGRLKVGV